MILDLIDEGLSYSTIKKAFEVARSCMEEYCNEDDINKKNPCDAISLSKYIKKPQNDIVYFTEEERKLIIRESTRTYKNGAPIYRFGWAIIVLMYTGLRVGELLAMTWDDVDFVNKTINVNKNAVSVKIEDSKGVQHYTMLNQESTKTESGVRSFRIPDVALEGFKELYKMTGKYKFIMTTRNGTQATTANIGRMFHKIINATGLADKLPKNHSVHSLRHTFATMMFANGSETKIASEIFGHADTRITENIYIHVIEEMKNKAIEDINKFCT